MFTGIVETTAKLQQAEASGDNIIFELSSPITSELKIDQSLSHNGVCLTVTGISGGHYKVTAVRETLNKSNLGNLQPGDLVNLERSMPANGRFDGHVVQGHVDQVGQCTKVEEANGSWLFDFAYDFEKSKQILVEKGSVCINGVSLTVFNVAKGRFTVTIIPYTFEHTNFKQLNAGDSVNLEFDIIGKYIQGMISAGIVDPSVYAQQ